MKTAPIGVRRIVAPTPSSFDRRGARPGRVGVPTGRARPRGDVMLGGRPRRRPLQGRGFGGSSRRTCARISSAHSTGASRTSRSAPSPVGSCATREVAPKLQWWRTAAEGVAAPRRRPRKAHVRRVPMIPITDAAAVHQVGAWISRGRSRASPPMRLVLERFSPSRQDVRCRSGSADALPRSPCRVEPGNSRCLAS